MLYSAAVQALGSGALAPLTSAQLHRKEPPPPNQWFADCLGYLLPSARRRWSIKKRQALARESEAWRFGVSQLQPATLEPFRSAASSLLPPGKTQ